MKYEVTYTESYARTYEVEADSKPDDCYDSDYTVSIINEKEDN